MKLEYLNPDGTTILEWEWQDGEPIPCVGDDVQLPLNVEFPPAMEPMAEAEVRNLRIVRRTFIYKADPLQSVRYVKKVQFRCE